MISSPHGIPCMGCGGFGRPPSARRASLRRALLVARVSNDFLYVCVCVYVYIHMYCEMYIWMHLYISLERLAPFDSTAADDERD